MSMMTRLKAIFDMPKTPIDLPTDGQRIVHQGVTERGGYPIMLLENREQVALHAYFASLQKVHRAENQRQTQYLEDEGIVA